MDPSNVLEVRNLAIEFHTEDRTVHAVRNIDFDLPKGRTLGIVGESGSGKSVTSLAIMRLIPTPPGHITGGEIGFRSPRQGVTDLMQLKDHQPSLMARLQGAKPHSPMSAIRGKEISMIFQEPMTSLNPVFSCGDQVTESLIFHENYSKRQARERALELFREVELPRPEQIFDAYPHQISGGQKQRVMIAMAMACNPAILIADEPTTALDVTVQKTILDLMERLRIEHNMSIVFITHDLGVIAEIADDVLVMYNGEIVERGPVKSIFDDPQHPYTKGLLACRPQLDIRLQRLPTISDFMRTDEQGQLQENPVSVDEALNRAVVSEAAYHQRQQQLKTQHPVLRVENLKTHFPVKSGFLGRLVDHVKAVDDVSFEVYPGETLGLVGESGCGKTTLGRTILRLIEPTGGHIYYGNQELTGQSLQELRKLRRQIQIIFQDPYGSLNPRMTIGRAILEPMQVHGLLDHDRARQERVVHLLERVNLSADHYDRYPHEFSGGQRQRICIARTLALDPQFIICDESVSALDVSVQAQVLNLLNELREDFDLTYIFISHDLSVVKFMSDRMMVMKDGQVVEAGLADDIYHRPREAYTQKLIDAIPRGRIEDIEAAIQKRQAALQQTNGLT
jgi:peptide/nickel transport system ATP-binding protein